jgi:hypothetical protein
VLGLLATVTAVVAAIRPDLVSVWNAVASHVAAAVAVLAGVVAVVAYAWSTIQFRRLTRMVERRAVLPMHELARRYHAQLRYMETQTLSVSGQLKAPMWLEVGGSRSRQRTANALSYPQLVDEFRWFIDQVGLQLRARDHAAKIIICIDELDKIATSRAAEDFVNDIKSVFGVDGCYFLVAVSEDALAGFQLRSLSVRSTFDSAFDTIVEVGPFDLEHTRRLLISRLGRVPEPMMWLCHLFSGGLPRDLNRAVRALHEFAGRDAPSHLTDLARHLVEAEIAAISHDDPGIPGTGEAAEWVGLAGQLYASPGTSKRAESRRRLGADLLWAATVLQALADKPELIAGRMRDHYDPDGVRPESPVDVLAGIRQHLSGPAALVWPQLQALRESLGLSVAAADPAPVNRA